MLLNKLNVNLLTLCSNIMLEKLTVPLSPEIPHGLQNLKVDYQVHNSLLLVLALRAIQSIHSHLIYLRVQ